jgi:DNA-binding IclR family transcriptional regulator
MPGIKGMTPAEPNKRALRNKIWQSMRIMRRFTLADLCRTSGAKRTNVRKFVKRLEVHGYVVQQGHYVGGRVGVFRGLRLVKNTGPTYPMRCTSCGRPLGAPCKNEQEESTHEDKALD